MKEDAAVIMIGNAHLVPVWLWTRLEGFAEVVSTIKSAVMRAEEGRQVCLYLLFGKLLRICLKTTT